MYYDMTLDSEDKNVAIYGICNWISACSEGL